MKERFWYQNIRYERQARGWTQKQIAEMVGSTPKTVTRWEKGETLPRLYHRQELARLFGKSIIELGFPLDMQEAASDQNGVREGQPGFQEDLWDAPHIEGFYGRGRELHEAKQWLLDSTCRMIAILGIGGIGKTSLAAVLTQQIKTAFQYVLWISLSDAPFPEDVLKRCLVFFSGQQDNDARHGAVEVREEDERRVGSFLAFLRTHRCLLVLDNFESVLQKGSASGHYREGYETYALLLQRLGEAKHQSCLLLTSREKPGELALLENATSAVRTLSLVGVEHDAGRTLLETEKLHGPEDALVRLIDLYGGNPLSLKLIAEPIRAVYGGDVSAFLHDGELVLGGTRAVLDSQFERLSGLEQEVMYWLAVEREPVTRGGLRANIVHPIETGALIEALSSLRRRSLIEVTGEASEVGDARFTLQPVIMEYIVERLKVHICKEIEQKTLQLFSVLVLMKAQARDYIRKSQKHLILEPILARLVNVYGEEGLKERLREFLVSLRAAPAQLHGYAAGNLLNMLISLHADLRGCDFSSLVIRQAYMQGVALPQVNFSYADFIGSVFNETSSGIYCATLSPNGQLLAVGMDRGEIRLWHAESLVPLLTCLGHTTRVYSLDFNRDGMRLVSGSEDFTVRLWNTENGHCLRVLRGHSGIVRSVAFDPQGGLVASGSEDRTVRLWDVENGRCLMVLQGHESWVRSIAFYRDGHVLASSDGQEIRLWDSTKESEKCIRILRDDQSKSFSRPVAFSPTNDIVACGSDDGVLHFWELASGRGLATFQAHSKSVRSIAFRSDGKMMVSSGEDETIKLWETDSWRCIRVLRGHTSRIRSVTFDPSGERVVSASADQTIRFWEVRTGYCLKTLQGHTNLLPALAFSPDGKLLAAGSEDTFIRLWDVESGHCLRTLRGHTEYVRSVAFSADGTLLVSGSEDETVRIWQVRSGQRLKTLRGHAHTVRSVAFSSDGRLVASGSYDWTVRLWDAHHGVCVQVLHGHSDILWIVAFHSDNRTVVSCGRDEVISLWDVLSGACLRAWTGQSQNQRVKAIFIFPDTNVITGGIKDEKIYLWDSRCADPLKALKGHTDAVQALAFSRDGMLLASGSYDRSVRLWDVQSGECLRILDGQGNSFWSVAFSQDGSIVASGTANGQILLWDVRTGEHVRTLRSERPYEGMDITGTKGLSEPQRASLIALGAVERGIE